MSPPDPFPRRLPRRGRDPITEPGSALAVVATAVRRPWRRECILVPLDQRFVGGEIIAIDGTDDLEHMIDVVMPVLWRAGLEASWLLAATAHPEGSLGPPDRPDWADRWLAAAAAADRVGCPLLEWFALGPGGPWCPRDLLGVAPRWPR